MAIQSFPGPMSERFLLTGPLPTGTTMLEASAGTGKTFTLAALVARYIAEDSVAMDQLLVISFSRESARELQDRVRARLVSARDGLARIIRDGGETTEDDEVLAQLANCDRDEQVARHGRLNDALATYDTATVTTTHGFCFQALTSLGTACDFDQDARLTEDLGDLVTQVADDIYLECWGGSGAPIPPLPADEAREIALAVTADPATRLIPDPGQDLPGQRAGLALTTRIMTELRKRRRGVISYDDLQLRLDAALQSDFSSAAARDRLRQRYRVVLVDEFQDTDPVQWRILRDTFHDHATLILIGDPKQAIYAFRGADVQAYLEAMGEASRIATLPVSYRADQPLLDGLDAIFGSAALGDTQITVRPVEAAHPEPVIRGGGAAVRLRVFTDGGKVDPIRQTIMRDVVAETTSLLTGDARLHPRDGSGERPLRPEDIAVLVRTNKQAQELSVQLAEAGVPAVVHGRTSIWDTPAADEWQVLLEALEQPHRTTRVRRLALSYFVGATAAELGGEGRDITDGLALELRSWAGILEDRGVGTLFSSICLAHGLHARVLPVPGGERLLTDLRHITHELHEAASHEHLGLAALSAWLRRRRESVTDDDEEEDHSRQLSSDAPAVQVLTAHTSKGLEFPLVMVPFGWDRYSGTKKPQTLAFHDGDRQRVRYVGGRTPAAVWRANETAAEQERADDELRLAYVALTRAQSRVLVWWAAADWNPSTKKSAVQRLLLGNTPGRVPQYEVRDVDPQVVLSRLTARMAPYAEVVAIEPFSGASPINRIPRQRPQGILEAAVFDRSTDQAWHRTSYSALTQSARDTHRFASEPEVASIGDETGEAHAPETEGGTGGDPDEHLHAVQSLWNSLPSGAAFGTAVHSLLEETSSGGTDVSIEAIRRRSPSLDAASLSDGLHLAASTPLGDLAGDRSLSDFPPADRLAEADFELPMSGGDDPVASRARLSGLVPLWREHCPRGPLAPYADALETLERAPLRGYLTGSIDAVLRVRNGPDGEMRYLVADYKTNRLAPSAVPLTAWHYRPEALAAEMIEAHYPLQALLYSIALHRFLRWRQPGYDPAQHLGGVLYLFLRGMSGPGVTCSDGSRPGVFAWHPAPGLVVSASDLLAGQGD